MAYLKTLLSATFALALIIALIYISGSSEAAPMATDAERSATFRELPYLENAYISAAPNAKADHIPVGRLAGFNTAKAPIVDLAQEIADGRHGNIDSLLIAHKGKLIFESYFRRGRIDLPHPQASATKAYTSLALGRAIQLGYLSMEDLNKPVSHFLKDLDPTKFVPGTDKVTLSQALTMRSGLYLTGEQKEAFKSDPSPLKGQGQVQTYFEQSAPITDASQTFNYKDDALFVIQVLEAVVPGSAESFIRNELFGKLGITQYSWALDVSGFPYGGGRSNLTSRDMIKLGTLMMAQGAWRSDQLIAKPYLARAREQVLQTGDAEVHYGGKNVVDQGYGYYFWSAFLTHANQRYYAVSAQGGFGQMIIMIDELDLMIVTTAHDNNTNYLQIAAERILPTFVP